MEERGQTDRPNSELKGVLTNQVAFMCNCGEEVVVVVKEDEDYTVVCAKCGQEYRFSGASVLRWGSES